MARATRQSNTMMFGGGASSAFGDISSALVRTDPTAGDDDSGTVLEIRGDYDKHLRLVGCEGIKSDVRRHEKDIKMWCDEDSPMHNQQECDAEKQSLKEAERLEENCYRKKF